MYDAQYDRAYNEGYRAYLDGMSHSDNPYTGVDEEELWWSWKTGWEEACYDD